MQLDHIARPILKVNFMVSWAANGVNKTSETPSVKRRMETVHPSAIRKHLAKNGKFSQSCSSKSLSAYKNKLQSPTIPSPFIFITEERAARRKQAGVHIRRKESQNLEDYDKAFALKLGHYGTSIMKEQHQRVDEETSCRAESLSQVSHDSYQKNRMKILKKRPIEIQLRASLFMKRENPNEAINVESADGMYDQKFMEHVDNKSLIGWMTRDWLDVPIIHWLCMACQVNLDWTFLQCNQQKYTWECGYYVMKWILDFVMIIQHEFPDNGNNLHGLCDSFSLGRFASESLAWEKWYSFPHNRYVEGAKSYAQPVSVAEKKSFFETYFNKVAAQKPAAAATAASLEQEKANAAASCHKSDVEERVYGTNHATRDLLTGISNFDSSQRIVSRAACRAIDAAAQSSAISLSKPLTEKIVVATDRKNAATLNNTDIFEDHPSVSKESGTSKMDRPLLKHKVLQPKISRKPATPSFRSSSYGTKQSKIPLSPANYASMHPRKENKLTPITKNSTALDCIDKRRAAQISLYTLMNSGSVKAACKSNSAPSRKIESTVATPSAHSTHKRCARPAKTPSKVTNRVNNQPMATPSKAANGVNKTSETPSVKRRMETPVHPSAVGSKTHGQKWQIFSAVLSYSKHHISKSLSAYKNKLQSPTIPSPFTFRTEERAARRKQAIVHIWFFDLELLLNCKPLLSFYNERASPKSPLEKAANGVNKTSETPSVNRRMETPVHPSAIRSKTPSQKWQIFSVVSKSLGAYKNKLQSPTIPSPFIFITEERAARRKQASVHIWRQQENLERQSTKFCFKARPLPNFYNERATPKSPLKKELGDFLLQIVQWHLYEKLVKRTVVRFVVKRIRHKLLCSGHRTLLIVDRSMQNGYILDSYNKDEKKKKTPGDFLVVNVLNEACQVNLDWTFLQGNNLHGLGDSVSLGRFASESLAWEKWSSFPHNRYVEEAKSYAQLGSVAEKKAFFETYFNKVAAQKPAAAATAASLEQEKANAAASCHKSDVEERVYGTNHATHDLLTGISNFDSSQRIVSRTACRAIDAVAQSSAISLSEPLTEKIMVATNRKNAATLNNTDIFEDHPSVSKESGTSQMDRPLLKVILLSL
ncbi:hypothetical protein Tco_1352519 [Tanacetum coccineum]